MTRCPSALSMALFSTFTLASCTTNETKTPPRLDERLPRDTARAGLITRASELIGGPTAKGRVGDYKIYNSKVAVIIGEPGASRGFQPYGGNIIDSDRVRGVGEAGESTFGEIVTALDL